MAFALKSLRTIRNNWKKSSVAAVALSYGYIYTKEYYEIQELMRVYCEKAAKYGRESIPSNVVPRDVTVILNPNANKRKAEDEFHKYCAPLLHLAGIAVNVVKTESEGHAKRLIDDLNSTDAIVVAGGDGTFSEVITGLLRRTQENTNGLVPLGILPLGRTNSVANNLFSEFKSKLEKIHRLVDATMAVVEERTKSIDVMRVELLKSEKKAVYAVNGIKWGAFRDAEAFKDTYWYFGKFRNYATYLFNGYKNGLTWNCEGLVCYTPPCKGCSNCTVITSSKKWYHWFIKRTATSDNIINPNCEKIKQKSLSTVDFNLMTDMKSETIPKLLVKIGPKKIDYLSFVKEGFKTENGENRCFSEVIEARQIEILPKISVHNNEKTQNWLSIDNENFELKPIRVTLLPKMINVFINKI